MSQEIIQKMKKARLLGLCAEVPLTSREAALVIDAMVAHPPRIAGDDLTLGGDERVMQIRRDSEPSLHPSVLFDEETAQKMNWEAVFGF